MVNFMWIDTDRSMTSLCTECTY